MHILEKRKRIFAYALNILLYLVTLPFRLVQKKKTSFNYTNPKILVSRLDFIGDILLSTPVYHSLKEKFPQSKIVLVCGTWAKSVLENNPYIDEIWTIDCPWWSRIRKDALKKDSFISVYKNIFKRIKAEKFDIFIDLRGDIRQVFLFGWVPQIPVRISNNRSGGNFLLTECIPYVYDLHEIKKNYQLLKSFTPIHEYEKPEVYHMDKDENFFKKFSIKEKYVVLFNGATAPLRRLQEIKIIDLVQKLYTLYQLQCIIVGGKEDVDRANIINEVINDESIFFNLCGKISLIEVKVLIDKAVLFIGIDSSVSHIVASTLTPAISLYGPMLPDQVKPLGTEKKALYHKYPCSPCLQKKCLVTGSLTDAQCMLDIKTEEILSLVDNLLTESQR